MVLKYISDKIQIICIKEVQQGQYLFVAVHFMYYYSAVPVESLSLTGRYWDPVIGTDVPVCN